MSGIERYAACVSENMVKIDKENKYVLFFRNEIHKQFIELIDEQRVKSVILKGNNKLLFYQIVLPFNLYKIKADRYLFFAFTNPILFRKKGIYNTIHDMGPWDSSESMDKKHALYWRINVKCAISTSDGIITVSNFSKKRINEILKYPEEKIRVIYSAVYDKVSNYVNKDYENLQKEYNLPNKYIMTLSTLEPRKNMKILLDAFSNIEDKVDYDLVLVGRNGWMMDEVIEKYNKKNRIHMTGFIKDEDLAPIYQNALCFVFPSLYEGFGLPPIEALSLGTPVIASNAASIPEIMMDRALYFKNNSTKELENILLNLEDNIKNSPKTLNEFQRKNYNFKESAKKVLEFITE